MGKKIQEYLKKITLVYLSIVFSLLVAEGISGIILDSTDYLKPKRVPDNILDSKLLPNTGAHDSWGIEINLFHLLRL